MNPPLLTAISGWKGKAIVATRGNQSRLGCMVICMLGYLPKNPPRMRGLIVITVDGRTLVDCELNNGAGYLATDIGHIDEVRDNFRRLADHLKLEDKDRIAMFDELRKWIKVDMRASSDQENDPA